MLTKNHDLWRRLSFAAAVAAVVTVSAPPRAEAQLLVSTELGSRWDWLYADDPLLITPSETVSTDINLESIGSASTPFSGPVHLRVDCCVDALNRQPLTGANLTAVFITTMSVCPPGIYCHPLEIAVPGGLGFDVSPSTPATAKMRVAASSSAALGQFIATVYADSSLGTLTKDVWINVIPSSLPADGTPSACAPTLEVISLGSITPDPLTWKKSHLTQTSYEIGAVLSNGIWGLDMTFEDPSTTTGPLNPDVSEVMISNNAMWPIEVRTADSFNCAALSTSVVIPANSTTMFSFTKSGAIVPGMIAIPTTTLILSHSTCRANPSLFNCWGGSALGMDDIATFSEGNFWTLFGGRRVRISTVGPWAGDPNAVSGGF